MMKKFIFLVHPVIHRHHLMFLDLLLWMIHQENHQSWKMKIKEIWVTVFPLWTFLKVVFCESSHIMAAYMNFAISLCAGIHKFQLWCHYCLFWDLTGFHQNRYTFFCIPAWIVQHFHYLIQIHMYPLMKPLVSFLCTCQIFLNMNPQ